MELQPSLLSNVQECSDPCSSFPSLLSCLVPIGFVATSTHYMDLYREGQDTRIQMEWVFMGASSNESDVISTLYVVALGAIEIGASLYACLKAHLSIERQVQIDITIDMPTLITNY